MGQGHTRFDWVQNVKPEPRAGTGLIYKWRDALELEDGFLVVQEWGALMDHKSRLVVVNPSRPQTVLPLAIECDDVAAAKTAAASFMRFYVRAHGITKAEAYNRLVSGHVEKPALNASIPWFPLRALQPLDSSAYKRNHKADIVLVPERVDALAAWRMPGSDATWPEKLLISSTADSVFSPNSQARRAFPDLPKPHEVRMFTVSHGLAATAGASMDDLVRLLLTSFHQAHLGSRPLVFIAHGFGGIIVKQLLLAANDDPRYRCVAQSTCGIVYFDTPHKGWRSADGGVGPLPYIHPESEIMRALMNSDGSRSLRTINDDFLQKLRAPFLNIVATKPFEAVDYAQLTDCRLGDADLLVGDDHVNVSRFQSARNETFAAVRDALVQWLGTGRPRSPAPAKIADYCVSWEAFFEETFKRVDQRMHILEKAGSGVIQTVMDEAGASINVETLSDGVRSIKLFSELILKVLVSYGVSGLVKLLTGITAASVITVLDPTGLGKAAGILTLGATIASLAATTGVDAATILRSVWKFKTWIPAFQKRIEAEVRSEYEQLQKWAPEERANLLDRLLEQACDYLVCMCLSSPWGVGLQDNSREELLARFGRLVTFVNVVAGNSRVADTDYSDAIVKACRALAASPAKPLIEDARPLLPMANSARQQVAVSASRAPPPKLSAAAVEPQRSLARSTSGGAGKASLSSSASSAKSSSAAAKDAWEAEFAGLAPSVEAASLSAARAEPQSSLARSASGKASVSPSSAKSSSAAVKDAWEAEFAGLSATVEAASPHGAGGWDVDDDDGWDDAPGAASGAAKAVPRVATSARPAYRETTAADKPQQQTQPRQAAPTTEADDDDDLPVYVG